MWLPAMVPMTVGRITSLAPDSARAIVVMSVPEAIAGRYFSCCSGEPKSVIANATTPVLHNGTGAT